MDSLFRNLIDTVLVALILALAGIAFDLYSHSQVVKDELASFKTMHATAIAQATTAALTRLQVANQRAEQLQVTLYSTEQQLSQLSGEKRHAIQTTTRGGRCFNAGTVRVLNATKAAGNQTASLPEAASGPDASDGPVATDTDVARWVVTAQDQYATCRARFQALIDWHNPLKQKEVTP